MPSSRTDFSVGGGEVASADGMRFVVPIRTVHAGLNPKYFGKLKGVTWYNLLSDQFTGLNAIPTPGTLRAVRCVAGGAGAAR
jgi:TnpA family transposase